MPVEAVAAIGGLLSSFLSGLLGIGGGLVLTPLLLYLPGIVGTTAIPVKLVTGLTVVQAISWSSLGVWRHRAYGNVSWRLVRLMGPVSAVTSLAGALLSRDVSDRILVAIFAAFALAGAVLLRLPDRAQNATVDDLHVNVPLAIGIAAGIGFFGGMVGIGAIAFIMAMLVYALRIPPRIAIGSSLGIGVFGAVAALVGKAATAQIDPPLAAIVFAAALVASPAGAAVSVRTHPRRLVAILSFVMLLFALRMTVTALTGA